ncbi:MAG: hypothetical protein JNL74_07465, partial [Fibrobacteres bacterium]|nr:hypothetical protein [Fibrobacterota bacterium]
MIKIFLLITIVGAALASEPRPDFIRTPELNGDLYFKTVSVGEVTTTLFALPLAYSCALNKELSFDAATTPVIAFTSLDNSTVVRLSGLKGRLTYNFRNMLLGTVGVHIPTGTNKFSGEELLTAGNVSSRQLGFSEGALYNTIDIFGSAAAGMVFKDLGSGDLSIGLGGSFLYKGSFIPTDVADSVYDPGSEGNISLAVEYLFLAFERRNTLLLDFGVTMYGEDKYSGETFRRGNKLNWSLTAQSSVNPKIPLSLRIANYIKGANENPGRFG